MPLRHRRIGRWRSNEFARCSDRPNPTRLLQTNSIRNVGDRCPPPSPPTSHAARDARRLSTLLEVSQALSGTLNLKVGAAARARDPDRAITASCAAWSRCCATASCTSRRSRASRIARAPVRYQGRRGHHRPGRRERQADRRAARQPEPVFLNRAPRRPELAQQELSFICVPILLQPPGGRRARRRPPVQAGARLRQQRQVPRHRQRR